MISAIWYTIFLQPVFNVLMWIYANIADQNLGWAVIFLTLALRLFLLPLSIISERNAVQQEKFEEEAATGVKAFRNDPVAQSEEIKRMMKKYRISPWAKVAVLFVQALVLVLLYQVFLRGITGDKVIKLLYPALVDFPGKINTMFYGFDIGKVHDVYWSGLAAVYLFISIFLSNRNNKKWEKSQFTYLFLFPLFTFGILWLLPMVKALFILTTMIFSDTITLSRKVFFPLKSKKS